MQIISQCSHILPSQNSAVLVAPYMQTIYILVKRLMVQ